MREGQVTEKSLLFLDAFQLIENFVSQENNLKYIMKKRTKKKRSIRSSSRLGKPIRVAVRVRPFINDERNSVIEFEDREVKVVDDIKDIFYKFKFDHTLWSFDPRKMEDYASQENVFKIIGTESISNAFNGYQSTIIAYGQIGSGKTYTIFGKPKMNNGLIHYYIKEIFQQFEMRNSEKERYELHISMLEIYQNRIRDLLNIMNPDNVEGLRIREDPITGPRVSGLRKARSKDATDACNLVKKGLKHRVVCKTLVHDNSSRGHCIVTLHIKRFKRLQNSRQHSRDMSMSSSGERETKIWLVDMAGIARENTDVSTHVKNSQIFQERQKINLSCTHFGVVIDKLIKLASTKKNNNHQKPAKSSTRDKYISFRDSKLTWLLKESIADQSNSKVGAKTFLIGCISPSRRYIEESLSTLRFCSRAKQLRTFPKIIDDKNVTVLINDLKDQIQYLTMNLEKSQLGREEIIRDQIRYFKERELDQIRFQYQLKEEELHQKYEGDLRNYQKTVEDLKVFVKSMKNRKDEQDDEVRKLHHSIDTLRKNWNTEIDNSQQNQLRLKKQFSHKHRKLEGKIQRLNDELLLKQSRESELSNEVNQLQNEMIFLQKEFESKRSALKRLEREKDKESVESSKMIQSIEIKIVILEKQVNEKNDRITKLIEQIKRLKRENKELKLSIESLKNTHIEIEGQRSKLEFENQLLQQRVKDMELQIEELRNVGEINEKRLSERERERKEASDEKKQLLLNQIERLERKLVEKEERLRQETSQQKDNFKKKLGILKTEHRRTVDKLQEDLKDTEDELHEKTNEIVQELQEENENLKRIISDREAQSSQDLLRQKQTYDKKLMDLEESNSNEISDLQKRHREETRQVVSQWHDKFQKSENQVHKSVLEVKELKSRIDEVQRKSDVQKSNFDRQMNSKLHQQKLELENEKKECILELQDRHSKSEEDLQKQVHDQKLLRVRLERKVLEVKREKDAMMRRLQEKNKKLLGAIDGMLGFRSNMDRQFVELKRSRDTSSPIKLKESINNNNDNDDNEKKGDQGDEDDEDEKIRISRIISEKISFEEFLPERKEEEEEEEEIKKEELEQLLQDDDDDDEEEEEEKVEENDGDDDDDEELDMDEDSDDGINVLLSTDYGGILDNEENNLEE